jgi:hypothetical protein
MLTDEHKQKCMGAPLSFLEHYHRESDEFLDHIVTGDEIWVLHCAPERKRQSQDGIKPTLWEGDWKFKQTHSVVKIMASVFWDRKGILVT